MEKTITMEQLRKAISITKDKVIDQLKELNRQINKAEKDILIDDIYDISIIMLFVTELSLELEKEPTK